MSQPRRGFTLVELLVVVGIMAVMFSLLVTGSSAKPTALRAAQEFASMLLTTQSRALGKPQGAAILIETDVGAPRLGSVTHEGDTLPPIVMSLSQSDYGVHNDFPDLVTLTNISAGNSTLLQNCYKMRFLRKYGNARAVESPWLGLRVVALEGPNGFQSGTPPDPNSVGLPVRRGSAGQGLYNTFFSPRDTFIATPPGSNLANYEAIVVRYPTIGLNSTKVPPNLAIDLRYSGVGDNLTAPHGYGSFEGIDPQGMAPLAIVFDQTGRVSEVIQRVGVKAVDTLSHDLSANDVRSPPNPPPDNDVHANPAFPSIEHPEWRDPLATDPIVPNEIIYFLFVDREAIVNDESLQSESAAWVALDPLTGRISVSSSVLDVGGNVALARERARAAVAFGK